MTKNRLLALAPAIKGFRENKREPLNIGSLFSFFELLITSGYQFLTHRRRNTRLAPLLLP